MKIVVLYGSTREHGNTEVLTEQVIKNLPVQRIFLKDFQIAPIVDQRHDESGFTKVRDDYEQIVLPMMDADVLIFATPIYWYGMSSIMKTYIDRWSQTARDDGYSNFKEVMSNKQVYLIAVGGDEPRIKGLPLIQQFEYICEFMNFTFKDYILGNAVKPSEIIQDEKSMQYAKTINKTLLETQ
ncbi:flavodoxin family protein [Bacillus hwajinpoensis]|uniref:Flavodoxin family protein n=1 Tax=Guptibacillus hwajinpoensis TaxID=208199 RepID=A0A845EY53_9BACL|nr:NAD(P)H-dependent oxidoreductase [Pseudalkalibacillus hwajinpoensis]MYL63455.1 flavodoxin family protein [Pseudalkalibacillus hwajinpoensis]